MHLEKLRYPRGRINVFTPGQCDRILSSAHHFSATFKIDWYGLVNVALCTGMRRGELLNLVWSDVDFER